MKEGYFDCTTKNELSKKKKYLSRQNLKFYPKNSFFALTKKYTRKRNRLTSSAVAAVTFFFLLQSRGARFLQEDCCSRQQIRHRLHSSALKTTPLVVADTAISVRRFRQVQARTVSSCPLTASFTSRPTKPERFITC